VASIKVQGFAMSAENFWIIQESASTDAHFKKTRQHVQTAWCIAINLT
jgi:hypothetical protein